MANKLGRVALRQESTLPSQPLVGVHSRTLARQCLPSAIEMLRGFDSLSLCPAWLPRAWMPIAGVGGNEDCPRLVHQVAAERELAAALAPVKNRAQLDAYLREHRGASSPFHVLRPAALQRFSGGLVFNDRGVSSYDYTTLQRELTASQIFGILRVFGVEDSVSRIPGLKVRGHADRLVLATLHIRLDGHHDMYCVAHGICAPRLGWVCTSNC